MKRLSLPLPAWMILSHGLVLALPFLLLVLTGSLARELEMEARGRLLQQASAVARLSGDAMTRADPAKRWTLREALSGIEADTPVRVLLVDATAHVQVSPRVDEEGRDLSTDPAVAVALGGTKDVRVLDGGEVQVVVPVPGPDGRPTGAAVLVVPPRPVPLAVFLARRRLLLTSILATVCALGLAVWTSVRISRPLRRLSEASRRVARDPSASLLTPHGAGSLPNLALSRVREVAVVGRDVEAMAGRLQDRARQATDAAAAVAHEFKTPLASLLATAEVLEEDEKLSVQDRQRFFAVLRAEITRLRRLVDGLLTLARAKVAGPREPVDLDTVVRTVAARTPGVTVSGGAGAVDGERAALETVVQVLVDNAVAHGGPGIRVEGWIRGDQTGLDVVDDGPGISPGNVPRVFERFFTTARGEGHTGLGLALAQTLCRVHGGDLVLACPGGAEGETRFRAWFDRR